MGRKIIEKNVQFKKICTKRSSGKYFSYFGILYRMGVMRGDDGIVPCPENMITGNIDSISNDSMVKMLDHDKVMSALKKIAKGIILI